jgi:CDP-glucose 4,6-dehydratase
MFSNFYQNKNVLVTGVAGVKGSWLAMALLEAGAHVVGLDNAPTDAKSNFAAAGLHGRITMVPGDVADVALLRSLLQDVDCIFHLAAVALVGEAAQNPFETYRSNVLGTAGVLEAFRDSDSATHAVFVTTDKVYRSKGGEVWVETDPLVASGPYAVSKACSEFLIADYYRSYLQKAGKKIGIGRAGNVVIGGDFNSSQKKPGAGRIVVDCFEALAENRPPEIFSPQFTRPYTYGLDILSGYMTLMAGLNQEGVDGEAFNFGPHEPYGIENGLIATKICERWGAGISWKSGALREEPFEKQSLSWEKARRLLGWQPAYTIDEGLRDTTDWYREWVTRGKEAGEGGMADFNRSLIARHREAAVKIGLNWTR